jgi:hypothetical protein
LKVGQFCLSALLSALLSPLSSGLKVGQVLVLILQKRVSARTFFYLNITQELSKPKWTAAEE